MGRLEVFNLIYFIFFNSLESVIQRTSETDPQINLEWEVSNTCTIVMQ